MKKKTDIDKAVLEQVKSDRKARQEVPPTNADIIRKFMKMEKVRGNPKNYVVVMGDQLLDFWDTYEMTSKNDEGKAVGVRLEGAALIHKRKLHGVVGNKFASLLWNKKLGMRVNKHKKGAKNETRQG